MSLVMLSRFVRSEKSKGERKVSMVHYCRRGMTSSIDSSGELLWIGILVNHDSATQPDIRSSSIRLAISNTQEWRHLWAPPPDSQVMENGSSPLELIWFTNFPPDCFQRCFRQPRLTGSAFNRKQRTDPKSKAKAIACLKLKTREMGTKSFSIVKIT